MQVAVAALFMASLVREAITTGTEVIILNSVCGGLVQIEREIDQLRSDEPGETPPLWSTFESLEFRQITYDNVDALAKARFTVGPFDLTIKPGEIVFLTGSNGSGKSSVLRLIAGLYPPHRGDVLVDGHALRGDQFVQYRSLISCIFAEHYLFHKLYGFEVDPVRAARLIDQMGLRGKTDLVDGTFSTLALSSGQRTRIAMISALLEDRPIYLFDEWAADQDPGFRHRFYREILPQLKAAGKAVIAITHDTEYFPYCDRLYDVRRGRLVEITEVAVGASL
jgi:putative ATP-binding cassette transporter